MKKMCVYYIKEGNRIHVKDFNDISDMFHWCEMNCKRSEGNYYMNGQKLMCDI